MKKFKLIPVLAVSMLLAACQTGIKVSKPKFAAEGSSMELKDFVAEFIDMSTYEYGPAIKDSEFFQKEPKIGSKEEKGIDSSSRVVTTTLNGKERSKIEVKSSEEVSMQGDSENHVIIAKTKSQAQRKEKDLYGASTRSESEKREMTYQEGKGKYDEKEDQEGVVLTDDIAKEYAVLLPIVDGGTYTKDNWYSFIISQQAQGLISELFSLLPVSVTDEKELAKYSYFKNDKIYTVKYSSNDEPVETKATIKGEEKVVRKTTEQVEAIYQLDITEGKWSYKSSVETTTTTEDLEDYDYYRKGLKEVEEEKSYSEVHLNDKKVSLKARDLAKYEDRGKKYN